MPKYQVKLFLSTYTQHIVEAADVWGAYAKAEECFKGASPEELGRELLANAECLPLADTVKEVKGG